MKEATSLSPPSPQSPSLNFAGSDVEEYQVDSASTSSKEDGDDCCDADGQIVVAENSCLPPIGSVSVVNSNEVHIGNKTVYQGPVTIKQFVYPNGSTPNQCVSGIEELEDAVKSVVVDPQASGVVNPGFVGDVETNKSCAEKDASCEDNNAQRTLPGIGKGLLWLRNLPKQYLRDIVILISVVLASAMVVTGILYWKHSSNVIDNVPMGDTDEQDNNSPADYPSDSNITINRRLRLISRLQWLAQPPIEQPNVLKTPVSLIIIQHTATVPCASLAQCIFQVKVIQKYHIESNGWWDIGYNFLTGGDGAAYEGRGWTQEGAHTLGYNNRSIGVGFIGTFTAEKPPKSQIVAFKKLIDKGVDLGYITKDYKILGARQLYGTESPGTAFFKEIKTWPHWAPEP